MIGEAPAESVDPKSVFEECGRQLGQLAAQGQGRGNEEFELVLGRRIAASRSLPPDNPNSHLARTTRNEPMVYRHTEVSASLVAAARFGHTLEQAAQQDAGQQQ
jgi:hypothetical protein